MTSPKQIAANQQNAQASTGPKTGNGKAIAAQNAVKHGLRAAVNVVVPGIENARDWKAHLAGIFASLQPVGYVETILCERIAAQSWRLVRACRYETTMIQSSQETVEDDLNQRRRIFSRTSMDATHPADIRGWLRHAKVFKRLLKKLDSLADGAPMEAEDAAGIVWNAFDVAEVDDEVHLPGIADDSDLYDTDEFAGFTAGEVRGCIRAVAHTAKMSVTDLMADMAEHAHLDLVRARTRAEESERELTHMRRERELPLGDQNHEKLQRYESALERSLYRTLHELERLQAKRSDGNVPAPAVLDVDVRTGT